jgi:cytochrome c
VTGSSPRLHRLAQRWRSRRSRTGGWRLDRRGLALVVVVPAAVLVALSSCGEQPSRQSTAVVPGANPERGARLLSTYGCGSCHTVDGVPGANGLVGPPLTQFGRRAYIAGELVNGPQTLQRWVMSPQSVEPGTAMPNLGVTAPDARDIAAFLLQDR